MDRNGIMFLRFFIIILSLFLLASVFDNPNNFNNGQLNKDIRILESIRQRKPGDLKILKMLVQNYFLKENFRKVILLCSKFLTLKKDKEVAYLKIISLINSNKKNARLHIFKRQLKIRQDNKEYTSRGILPLPG